MRTVAVVGAVIALASAGCASADLAKGGAERDFSGFARRPNPSLNVGEVQVVDSRVHPPLPLRREAKRVQLEGGRFVVCWLRGSPEEGRRALAQSFKPDGSPLGAPVVISPPNVDVQTAPQTTATDGQHVVATFVAASERFTELLAVPLEMPGPAASGERTARR
jgi:hypothetical protein